jgi:hypothetical protein
MFLQIALIAVLLAVSYVACSDRFAPRPPPDEQPTQTDTVRQAGQASERDDGH